MMVLFSVKRGNLGKKAQDADDLPDDVTFALYLNLLAVIVLAESAEPFSVEPSQEPPQVFGVDEIADDFGGVVDGMLQGEEDDGQYL